MRKKLIFLFTLLLLAYPLCIYIGLSHFSVRYTALFILMMLIARLILMKNSLAPKTMKPYFFIFIAGVIFSCLGSLFNSLLMIKLYPVMISLILFSSFFYSLFNPPTMVTRIAQSLEKEPLPLAIVTYTRKVTIAWCIFFIVNSTISFYTALYTSTAIWSLYNGLLSYLFMGALFSGELLVRYFVKKQIAGVAIT